MKRKRLISLLLVFILCVGLLPTYALATGTDDITAETDSESGTPQNSPKYLKDISVKATKSGTDLLYTNVLSTSGQYKQYEKFKFDPSTNEYNILVPDGMATTTTPYILATLKDNAVSEGSENPYGAFYSKDEIKNVLSTDLIKLTQYKDNTYSAVGMANPSMDTESPSTVYFLTGERESTTSDSKTYITFNNPEVYKFNFYRKASLKNFGVSYEDDTEIIKKKNDRTALAQIPPVNDFVAEDVKANTEKLKIYANVYTTNAVLKFADATGEYNEVNIDDTTKTFELNITQYEKKKSDKDGTYIVIPFMLDYTGNDYGYDSYYTLTVRFAAAPTITASDMTINVADLTDTWQPEYSAIAADGTTDKTKDVTFAYYKEDGTTKLDDVTAVKTYIGDATTNGKFVVTLSLQDANDITITVTVKPKEQAQTTGNFVKNITLSGDSKPVFTSFKKEQTVYNDIEIPIRIRSSNDILTLIPTGMHVTLEDGIDPSNMKYELKVCDADGTVRYQSKQPYDFGKESLRIFESFSFGKYPDGLPIGNYSYYIKLSDKNHPETISEYTFNLTLVPTSMYTISAMAGNNDLTLTPVETQKDRQPYLITEYSVTTPGINEITLKGSLNCYGSKIFYKEQDITDKFTKDTTSVGTGYTINLAECSKNNDGAYIVPLTVKYTEDNKQFSREYKLYVTVGKTAGWEITKQPEGGTYDKGTNVTLSVEVKGVNADDVSYQWQGSSSSIFAEANISNIKNATESTFTPPTTVGGRMYYRCVITGKDTVANQTSDVAIVNVNIGTLLSPEFVVQPGTYSEIDYPKSTSPYKTEYLEGETVNRLQASAGSAETYLGLGPATVEFKWYHNDKNAYDGATLLDSTNYYKGSNDWTGRDVDGVRHYVGGVIGQYNFTEKLPAGKHYYFCEVTTVEKSNATNRSATVRSKIVEITISPRGALEGFDGKGTESEPYLIKTVDNLKTIDKYVLSGDSLEGAVFKLANDITLPADWEPIGDIGSGGSSANKRPFSGIIDGDMNQITVTKGGRPLLEYTRDAVVKNLYIYGEEINSAGLLEKIFIDYGTDGIYQQYTDPDTITIENVTLKSGSKTRLSGLVGNGASSGINNIIIRNCTIEEGVVVGYTKEQSVIGSFAGPLNGRIENCVSYATIYGVYDVGGIAGSKNQTMGDCIISNCSFFGTIEASGGCVGGILGAGYIDETAPNTPPVTIRNCCVVANITGNSTPKIDDDGYDRGGGIGGIFGSEIGLRGAWDEAYISDNYFYGTITDTNPDTETRYDRVGGIMGELGSHANKNLHYENNYYLANDNYQGLGYFLYPNSWTPSSSFIAKPEADFTSGAVTELLNKGEFKNWKQYTSEDGKVSYPVHSNESVAYRLEIGGTYKDEYYISDELDLTGIQITAVFTDSTTKTLALNDVEVTGYDKNTRGVQTIKLKYGAASAEIEVTVLLRPSSDPTKNTITVKFTLLGDDDHKWDKDYTPKDSEIHTLKKGNLQPWIAKTSYTVDLNATVWDLVQEALNVNNITCSNPTGNYIESITRNGVTLGEFTNGKFSGWMYTINNKKNEEGLHPTLGVSELYLNDGDEIVFHYTDDYTAEKGSENWGPVGGGTTNTPDPEPSTEVTVKPTVTDTTASAVVDDKTVNDAISSAVENGSDNVTVKVELPSGTDESKMTDVSVEIPAKSVADLASKTDADLTVETPVADIKISNDGLAELGKDAKKVTVTATKSEDNNTVTITVAKDGVKVDKLTGGVTATLPVEDAKPGTVAIIVDENGNETIVKKSAAIDGEMDVKLEGSATIKIVDNAKKFDDIANEWSKEAIDFVSSRELFNGISATEFKANNPMTRGMIVTVLHRLEDMPKGGTVTFPDVTAGAWFADAVAWGAANGIVNGNGSGFAPNDNVSRQQLATFLYRYAKMLNVANGNKADLSSFGDNSGVADWAEEALQWAVGAGIIKGTTDGNLKPNGNATRGEVATMLQRFVNMLAR